MTRTLTRVNRYAGTCVSCGQRVAPDAGWTEKRDGRWIVGHNSGGCTAPDNAGTGRHAKPYSSREGCYCSDLQGVLCGVHRPYTPRHARVIGPVADPEGDAGLGETDHLHDDNQPEADLANAEYAAAVTYLREQITEPAPTGEARPGYYTSGSDFIVVVQNKAKTHTYAKRLVVYPTGDGRIRARWEYAPRVAATLAHLTPMTLDEAKAFGHGHGVCLVCTRSLTDNTRKGPDGLTSVERGIGPDCAKKF